MHINNYLRLALMFGENKATSFTSNLQKMISLVLYENYANGLTVIEIIKCLEEKYSLEFSDMEIGKALNDRVDRTGIICVKEDIDALKKEYSITPKKYEQIKERTDTAVIDHVILDFISTHSNLNITVDQFTKLLYRYLYYIFNSNADAMFALMSDKRKNVIFDQQSFDDTEKTILNEFIYWENDDKNKFVYNLISVCFDYCMMSIGDNKKNYSVLFNNKIFYLDTNVVFRMLGLNNQSRKKVIDSFINKCKEAKIQLCYTNFTQKELMDTITYGVNKIKNQLNGRIPLKPDAMRILVGSDNSEFYTAYVEWTKSPTNKYNDYEGFKNFLFRQCNSVLSDFKLKSFDDYEDSNDSQLFYSYYDSLKSYKQNKGRKINDSSLKNDVNNYMYVNSLNGKVSSHDFVSIPNYIISTDHSFAEWNREKKPSAVPTIVLPSVWYSILLQYAGRATEDDYLSFTRFLNFSFSDSKDEPDSRKIAILEEVLKLDESEQIKNETVYDIQNKLYTDYCTLEPEEIVEKSHKNVLEREIEKVRVELNKEKEEALAQQRLNFEISHTSSLSETISKRDLENEMKEKELKDKNNKFINKLAKKKTIRELVFYWMVILLMILIYLFGIYRYWDWIGTLDSSNEQIQFKYDFIKWIITVLPLGIIPFVYKRFLYELKYDRIYEKNRNQFEKEYETK